jgi:hypothetical protein
LGKRLKQCVEKGLPLFPDNLAGGGEESFSAELEMKKDNAGKLMDWADLLANLEAKRGDIGCHLVFYPIEELDQRTKDMLQTLPRFAFRSSFGKQESSPKMERRAK